MKKWPREYYASTRECYIKKYRKTTLEICRKAGIVGWRSWPSHKVSLLSSRELNEKSQPI